jgi:hypothetical protein
MSRRDDQPQAAPYKEGTALRAGTGPHGWGAENASFIGGRSEGRAAHPSPKEGKKNRRMIVELSVKEHKAFNVKNKSLGLCETV